MLHIRVANVPDDILYGVSRRKRLYYRKQALKVAGILNHKIMQSLLMELMKSENISQDTIRDIRVMVLPSMRDREYGDRLYGLYEEEVGRISIYPAVKYRSAKFLNDPLVSFQFVREAFDTLIHEVLHSKYSHESTVKRLTKKYLKRFYRMLSELLE